MEEGRETGRERESESVPYLGKQNWMEGMKPGYVSRL